MESGDKLKIGYWKIRGLVRSIVLVCEMAGAPYEMIYYDLLTKMNSSMIHIIKDEDEYSFWIIFIQISIYWKNIWYIIVSFELCYINNWKNLFL